MGVEISDKIINDFLLVIKKVVLNSDEEITDINIEWVMRLAKFHSLEYIIYLGINKLNITNLNKEEFSTFSKYAKINAYKSEVQSFELLNILDQLESNNIKHLPLKGAIVRNCYPNIQYRSMADLDILIPLCDIKKAGNVLKSIGYSAEHLGGNHDCYVKKPYMNVELHRAMLDETYQVNYYDDIWNKVIKKENKEYQYQLTNEDFFVYLIVHAAKHFSGGGTGLRIVLDIYYYLEKYKLDFTYVYKELSKMNLDKFGNILINISNSLFKNIKSDNNENEMLVLKYIISCGTYGTTENHSAVSLEEEKLEKSKSKLIFRRLFPSYNTMKRRNPILAKIPILLPLFWFTRLIKGLFNFKDHKKTYQTIKSIDNEKVNEVNRIKEITGVYL